VYHKVCVRALCLNLFWNAKNIQQLVMRYNIDIVKKIYEKVAILIYNLNVREYIFFSEPPQCHNKIFGVQKYININIV